MLTKLKSIMSDIEDYTQKDALKKQEGGTHYKKFRIQPAEFIHANSIPYLEGAVIKYLCRHRDKGGVTDLLKAKHYIDLIIQLEYKNLVP
jgi:hypothetical protein